MTKIRANQIKSAHRLSSSPSVVQIVYKDGGSDSYSVNQFWTQLTPRARFVVQTMLQDRRELAAGGPWKHV